MTIHRTRITADGRIQIPAQIRRELGLAAGDAVNLEVADGEIVVRRPSRALERIRNRLSTYLEPGTDLVSDLKVQRREDAARG